jgi:hypothetical protein
MCVWRRLKWPESRSNSRLPVFDVRPNASIHGWRDFLVHPATITIGLLTYATAREYSDIYGQQAEIERQLREALRDVSVAMGPL